MKTAKVKVYECRFAKDEKGRMRPQDPVLLDTFTVRDERLDGLREKAKAKARKQGPGKVPSMNFGPRNSDGSYTIFVTFRQESRR